MTAIERRLSRTVFEPPARHAKRQQDSRGSCQQNCDILIISKVYPGSILYLINACGATTHIGSSCHHHKPTCNRLVSPYSVYADKSVIRIDFESGIRRTPSSKQNNEDIRLTWELTESESG